jgi:plastocyanin
MSSTRTLISLCAAVAALAITAPGASAAAPVIATDDLFSAPSYSMDQGETLLFQNNGLSRHDVVATQPAPAGKAQLFESPLIATGSTPVAGTEFLTTGAYPFICTLHSTMKATLQVSGAGTPVPRPKVVIRIPATKRSKLAKSGKLKVGVSSPTEAAQTVIAAGTAAKTVTITIPAGASQKVVLKLSPKFRKKLAGKGKAKIKVTAIPRFGLASSAGKTLK